MDVYGFTGRTEQLATLHALLAPGERRTAVISAVAGTAGVGKTALAVHWAHQAAKRFPTASSTLICAATIRNGRCRRPTRWRGSYAASAWTGRTSPTFKVVGKKARVPLVHEGMNPAIVAFIRGLGQETINRIADLSDQEPHGILGVTDDADESRAEGTELDYYHAAATTAPAPDDLESLTVPAGTWAVFENSGPFPHSLQYMWRDVYTQWFPSNPYQSRPGPTLLSTRLSEDGTQADAELWIPVERTAG